MNFKLQASFISLIASAVSVAITVGCTPPPKQQTSEIKVAKKTQKVDFYKNSRLKPEEQQLIIAKVNDETFSLAEFERRLNDQPPFARSRYSSVEAKRTFLDQMLQFEILADKALELGYDQHPDVVLNLKQAMVRKMMADHISKNVGLKDVPEQAKRDYYQAHLSDYVRPPETRVSQIVVATEEESVALRAELVESFKARPTKKRRAFAKKAEEVSIDAPTAKQGGDMGYFKKPEDGGTVDKRISDAAFALASVADLSQPIQTDKGWHLLMLMGKRQAINRSFEDVERTITNRLYRELRVSVEKDFIAQAKEKAKVTLSKEQLAKIPDPPAKPIEDDHHDDDDHGDAKTAPKAPSTPNATDPGKPPADTPTDTPPPKTP